MKPYPHFINGRWHPPDTEQWIDSIDPSTGEPWARIARGNAVDAEYAVACAHAVFQSGEWSMLSARDRAGHLFDLADVLQERWPELVEFEVRDNGKRISEVRPQLSGLHIWYRYFAEQMLQIESRTLDNRTPGIRNQAYFEPYGVVVAIIPWNSPLMIAAWKIAPALAAGNTTVIKPSEHASVSILEFARLCLASSIPDGVINVVTGTGSEAGQPLVIHPDTRKVTFTGSDSGGSKVAEAASVGVVPVILELGGKSPQVVFEDADMDSAVNGILSGIFLSNGQTCVAGSRLIVMSRIQDQLVERIIHKARSLRPGDPLDENTQIAPLANEAHLQKVLSMIEKAKQEGATCICGGKRAHVPTHPNGYYVEPTVFTNVTPEMEIWREEVFGPVLAVVSFDCEDDAISLANDTRYGLAAGVWSRDTVRAQRVAKRIQAGTVYINHYRSIDPGSPVGGYKKSGYGRELGPDAVRAFLQIKSVWTGTEPCADPFPD